jgi:hypothetical protein
MIFWCRRRRLKKRDEAYFTSAGSAYGGSSTFGSGTKALEPDLGSPASEKSFGRLFNRTTYATPSSPYGSFRAPPNSSLPPNLGHNPRCSQCRTILLPALLPLGSALLRAYCINSSVLPFSTPSLLFPRVAARQRRYLPPDLADLRRLRLAEVPEFEMYIPPVPQPASIAHPYAINIAPVRQGEPEGTECASSYQGDDAMERVSRWTAAQARPQGFWSKVFLRSDSNKSSVF